MERVVKWLEDNCEIGMVELAESAIEEAREAVNIKRRNNKFVCYCGMEDERTDTSGFGASGLEDLSSAVFVEDLSSAVFVIDDLGDKMDGLSFIISSIRGLGVGLTNKMSLS